MNNFKTNLLVSWVAGLNPGPAGFIPCPAGLNPDPEGLNPGPSGLIGLCGPPIGLKGPPKCLLIIGLFNMEYGLCIHIGLCQVMTGRQAIIGWGLMGIP